MALSYEKPIQNTIGLHVERGERPHFQTFSVIAASTFLAF